MKIDISFNNISSRNYPIFINELERIKLDGKVAVITNETVAKLHLETFLKKIDAKDLYQVIIADGEQYKNLETIEFILNELFSFRLDRKSTLIAFGGGVIGDISGFCASIYERGINFIQVPTTLLSQVDASVGGKTGINNKFGKNLIGTFHQPIAVYCENSFLKTLPKREFNAGVAEIIKMATMFDSNFFSWLESNDLNTNESLSYAIMRSIEIKTKVVSLDEKEQGVRAVLNYGHTFAHVIENLSGYGTYLHGEAVSIGIVMANKLSVKLGLLSEHEAFRIEKLIEKFSLPTSYKIDNIDKFYDLFFLDKKSADSKIAFILANGIGKYMIKNDIDENFVKDVLKTI